MKGRGRGGGRLSPGRGRGRQSLSTYFLRSPSRRSTTNEDTTKNTKNMEAMKINFNESTNQRNFENFQRTLPSVKTGTKGWENSETLEEAI